MNRKAFRLFLLLLFFSLRSMAQTDAYSGTWQMEYPGGQGVAPVNMEIQIAASEKNILYPAHIKLQCDDFKAEYVLLLVKKSSRELGISRNKYPLSEQPFSLGNWPMFLNGTFDYSKDLKEIPYLSLRRIQSKQEAASNMTVDKLNGPTAASLLNFLKVADIKLKKVNNIPWNDESNTHILSPSVSPAYVGLLDTLHLQTRDGLFSFSGNKKTGTDIVSVALNGRTSFDQVELNKKKHIEEVLLDTGLNILTFFADNFGNELPGKGRLELEFGKKKLALDFANKADSAATFIVAKLYCDKDKENEKSFQNNSSSGKGEKALQNNERLIGSIISTSQQINLAIWDDAAEDGDSISINIDGKWIVQGFPVKKTPQFIPVKLKPGPNTIIFMADNLGSIPPNTSVLEIIDGKKRKSFFIETSLGENNLIKILYDQSAGY